MVKVLRGSDNNYLNSIPKQIAQSYNIKHGDELGYFVNGKGYAAQPGDLIVKLIRHGGGCTCASCMYDEQV